MAHFCFVSNVWVPREKRKQTTGKAYSSSCDSNEGDVVPNNGTDQWYAADSTEYGVNGRRRRALGLGGFCPLVPGGDGTQNPSVEGKGMLRRVFCALHCFPYPVRGAEYALSPYILER